MEPLPIAQPLRNAADEVALLDNLPAISEAGILQNIMNAITRVEKQTPSNCEYNNQARLYNAGVSSSQQILKGIRASANVQPPGFPITSSGSIALTDVQLNALLTAYDLPINGNVNNKRKRLRRFVGIVTDV